MTDIKKIKELLFDVKEIKEAEHIKSVPSAITTSWSEEIWTEDMIARDALQNHFDGCKENNLPIHVLDINIPGNLKQLILGSKIGSQVIEE